jgi:hypothetical protein
MKNIILYTISLLFASCSNEEHKCIEDYDRSVIETKKNYIYKFGNSKSPDSSIIYDKSDCFLIEKILYKDKLNVNKINFKDDIKKEFNTTYVDKECPYRKITIDTKELKVVELFDFQNNKVLNRYWVYNENLILDSLKSNLFHINFPDTVQANEYYIGNIDFNLYKKNDSLNIVSNSNPFLLVSDKFNKDYTNIKEIEVDTFITPKNRFAARFNKKGWNRLKIIILDRYLYDKKDEKEFIRIDEKYFVCEPIFVK